MAVWCTMISKPVGNKARCPPSLSLVAQGLTASCWGHQKRSSSQAACAGTGTKAPPPHEVSGSLTPLSSVPALISVCVKKGIAHRAVPSDQLLEKTRQSSWDTDCFHKQGQCFSSCNEMWGCLLSLFSPGCGDHWGSLAGKIHVLLLG